MMKFYRIIHSISVGTCLTSLQSWEGFQNLIPFMSKTPPSLFFQTKTWCGRSWYTMKGKINWPFNLLMFHMLTSQNSWKVNKEIWAPHGMECLQILSNPNGCQATNCQKPPRAYVANIYMALTFLIYVIHIPRCNHLRLECFLV
jgi:hypothetical protein